MVNIYKILQLSNIIDIIHDLVSSSRQREREMQKNGIDLSWPSEKNRLISYLTTTLLNGRQTCNVSLINCEHEVAD